MKKLVLLVCCAICMTPMFGQQCGGGGGTTGTSTNTGSVAGGVGSFASTTSFSSYSGGANLAGVMHAANSGKYLTAAIQYSNIDGSPYLEGEEIMGSLVMNDNSVITDVPMKYDLFAKVIVATDDDGEEIVLENKYYKEIAFEIDGQQIVYKKVNPKKPDHFYEVLYESGDVVFFKDQTARMKEGKNLGVARTESSFRQYSNYFVKGEDRSVASVNLRKRDLFDHLPEVEAVAMRERIKNTKIKLVKEKDYRALFASMDDD